MSCKEPFASEETIINELVLICEKLITNLDEVEPGLNEAINKFTRMMKITHKSYRPNDMVGSYVKYVLYDGRPFEKTQLIRNAKTNLALHNKHIVSSQL